MNITRTRAAVVEMLDRGWTPLPVPARQKRVLVEGWTTYTPDRVRDRLDDLFPSGRPGNVGVLLGSASGERLSCW